MMASRRILLLLLAILILLLFLAVPGVSWADSLEDAARNLARKIASALPAHRSITLKWENHSSLEIERVANLRRLLESELASLGHHTSPDRGETTAIRVVCAESIDSLIVIAEIKLDSTPIILMTSVPVFEAVAAKQQFSTLLVKTELVLEQEQPILDFAIAVRMGEAPFRLIVLESGKLAVYTASSQGWQLQSSALLPTHKPWPRDLRGWLSAEGEHLLIELPGMNCSAEAYPKMDLRCLEDSGSKAGSEAGMWSRFGEIVAGRNYLKAWPGLEKKIIWGSEGAFYFAAAFPPMDSGVSVVTTDLDGWANFYRNPKVENSFELRMHGGWGSEIAGVQSNCGSKWQLLRTGDGDWTKPDWVQAYEIANEEARLVSGPIQFSGPVTALWTAENETSVRAVVRNLKTGHYEAYRLTITCGK